MDIKRDDEKLIKRVDNIQIDNYQVFTRWIDPTIEILNKKLEKISNIVNNEKISSVEARLMIKDILEGKNEDK